MRLTAVLAPLLAVATATCASPASDAPEAETSPGPSQIAVTTGAPSSSPKSFTEDVNGLVSIGERRLFVQCRGVGATTVFFHNGASSWHHEWDPVYDDIARRTRACRYDLPNTGDSDPVGEIRTAADDVDDIHALERAGFVAPPYVMVSFSAGSLPSWLYASEHPDSVKGMVFLDPLLPGYEAAWQQRMNPEDREHRQSYWAGDNELRYDFSTSELQVGSPELLESIPVKLVVNDRHIRWETCGEDCEEMTVTAQRIIDEFAASAGGGEVVRVTSPHWVAGSHPELVRDTILSMLP